MDTEPKGVQEMQQELFRDFQVTTPETPLLSQQMVTNKGIQVPYQLTVESLPQYPIGLVL